MGFDVEKRFATELNRVVDDDRGLELDPRAQARRLEERRDQLRRLVDELTGAALDEAVETSPGKRTAVDDAIRLVRRFDDAAHDARSAFANVPWQPRGTSFNGYRASALRQVVSRLSDRKLRRATLGAAEPAIVGRFARPPEHVKDTAGHALWRAAERRAATLYRYAQDAGDVASEDPIIDEALARCGEGQALPAALRADMERELGVSLARVRVHTDPVASAAARAVRAAAFAVGEDIFFAEGTFAPDTDAGRRLLVHELTHVVQAYQGRTATAQDGIAVSEPGHALEREADANAERMAKPPARDSVPAISSPIAQPKRGATGTPSHGTMLLRQEAGSSSSGDTGSSSSRDTGETRPRDEATGAAATTANFEVRRFHAGPNTAGESGPVTGGPVMLVHVQSSGIAAGAHVRALTGDAQRYTVGFVQTMNYSSRRALYQDYDGNVVATYVASRGRVMDQRTDLGAPRPWYMRGILLGERSRHATMSDNPTWEIPRFAPDNSSLVARLEGSESFTTYLVAMVGDDKSTIVYLGNVQWEVNWAGRFDHRLRFHGRPAHIGPERRGGEGDAMLSGEPANSGSFGHWEQSRRAATTTSSTTGSAHGGGSGYGHVSDEAVASARAATHVPEGGNEVETPRGRRHLDLSERNADRVAELLEDPAVRAHIEETLEMFENDPDHPIPRSEIDLPLVLATAMREGGPELALSSSEHRIVSAGRDAHTLGRSGMDFLYDLRSRFPRAIRDQIQSVHGNPAVGGEFRRASTNPAYIRERDMLAAHIIEARNREQRFRRLFARSFSDRQGFTEEQRAALLASMSLDARRAWVQAAFGSRLSQLLTEARTRITRALHAGRTFEEVAADPSVNLCSIITDDSIMSGNLSRQRTRVTAAEARLINEVLPPELRYGPVAGGGEESAVPSAPAAAASEERATPTPAEIEAAAATTSAAPTPSPSPAASTSTSRASSYVDHHASAPGSATSDSDEHADSDRADSDHGADADVVDSASYSGTHAGRTGSRAGSHAGGHAGARARRRSTATHEAEPAPATTTPDHGGTSTSSTPDRSGTSTSSPPDRGRASATTHRVAGGTPTTAVGFGAHWDRDPAQLAAIQRRLRDLGYPPADSSAAATHAALEAFQTAHGGEIAQIQADSQAMQQRYGGPASRNEGTRATRGEMGPNDATAQALANAWPRRFMGVLLESPAEAFDYFASQVRARGLPFDPERVNIVGVRGFQGGVQHGNARVAMRTLAYDDSFFVLALDENGGKHVHEFRGTTDPGGRSTEHRRDGGDDATTQDPDTYQMMADQQVIYRFSDGASAKFGRPMLSPQVETASGEGLVSAPHAEGEENLHEDGNVGSASALPAGVTAGGPGMRHRIRTVHTGGSTISDRGLGIAIHSGGGGDTVTADSTGCQVVHGDWYGSFVATLRRALDSARVRRGEATDPVDTLDATPRTGEVLYSLLDGANLTAPHANTSVARPGEASAPRASGASPEAPAASQQAIARSAVTTSVPSSVPSSVPEEVQHALETESGAPLPDSAEWSERVGRDVGQSRIVTGGAAAAAARAIGARAFTVGNRVFFGEGHGPMTDGGDLLAHELTHVAQQAGSSAPASWDQLLFVDHDDAREQAARVHDGEALAAGSEQAIAREASPASADATAHARAQMRAALPLITTRWKLVSGDVFNDTGKPPVLSDKVFGHTAYALIVQDQVDLAPVMAALGGPGREKHLKAFQAAGNAFMADKPHFEVLKRSVDNLRAGGQIQYNATRVMAHQAMLSPYGKRTLASLAKLGTGELDAYIAGECRGHGEMERPNGGGELRVKGCQAILATLRTGAPAELPAPAEADAVNAAPGAAPAESPEVTARAKTLTKAIAHALVRRKSLAAGGTLTLSPPEQAVLQAAIDEAGPDARALVWADKAIVAQLAQVLDPKQAKNLLDRLDPVEALYRSCDEAVRKDDDPYARINSAQLPPGMAEEAHEGVRLKARSNVFQVLRTWLNTHARNQPLRMRVLQHTKLKDNFVDRLPDEDQRLIYRLIVRGTETATPEDMVHEAADKNDALGVIRGIRALAGSDPRKLAALERDPTFRASVDRMTEPVDLADGQRVTPYQLCMVMWGRRPDDRMDPNAIQQTEINPDPADDAPLTIPERLRLDRELFNPALTELNDEIAGKNLDEYRRRMAQQFHQRLGDPQHVMDTLVKYDRMAATDPMRGLLRREKLVFGAELEKRYFQRFGQPLRTWIYENSGPNNRSGSDRVLGLEQGAGVGMFNGKIVMAGEAAVDGKMSLQQALRETVYAGKPIYEHASVQSRELSRALDRSDLGGVNGAWCYFEGAVEACKAELESVTGIKIRAIDLMRNAYMEHGGHLETRLALKFKGDDLAFLRRNMGLKPGLDDDPSAGGPSVAEQAEARFGGISKSVWGALDGLSAASGAYEYTAACMLLQVARSLPAITDAPNAPPAPPQTTAVGHDKEERPPRSFAGFYRAQYGAHPDRHAAAVIRAMGNGKRTIPAERAAEMLKIDVGLVTGPVVADAEDSSIGPHNRHLVRADFTTEKARSNAKQIWTLLHVSDGKLATIESELYGPYNDEEQRLIRVEFRKLSGGFDLTFYIQQAIAARERTLREARGGSDFGYGTLASTNDWVIAEKAKHQQFAIGAEGTAEGKAAMPLGGGTVLIHGSATELDAALAIASHGELNAVDRVRNAVARGEDTEVLRMIDDLSVDERRQVLKNGKLIDDLERKLGQRDYERVFKVLTGQADLADRLYNNSIGRSWWKRHISHAADSSGMKEDVREYIRRLRLDFDRKVRIELATKFGPQDTPPPPDLIEQEINNRTRAACMDLAADKDIKQIIDDVLGSSDRAEIKSTLMNAGEARDWAVAAGASKTEILGEIKAMSDEERKAKLADPAYLQLLGKRLHDEKDYRDAMNALAAGQDGTGGKDGATGAGGLAKLDETSRTSVEIHGAKTDGRATLRALAALSRPELDRLAADPQMQLQVMNALSDDTQRALARELLFPAGSALPKSATGLDPQDAARLDHLVRQAVSRLRIACRTSNKWSAVLEEAVEVYKAPLDPASAAEPANESGARVVSTLSAGKGPAAASGPAAAPKGRVPAGLRAEVWKQVTADITAFAADHDVHRGAVTTDDITGAQMVDVARKAVMHEADPSDWLISAKIWTKEERLGGMSSGEAAIVSTMVDDEYEESDLIKVLNSASDEHVAREWSSVASEPSGGGETMVDRYHIFRASFAKAKAAIVRREAATEGAGAKASNPPPASSPGDVSVDASGAGASEPAAAQSPKWSSQVHELRDDDPDILRAEEDKQRFLLYVIQVSRQLEKMLRPFMGDHREVTPDRDPNAAKISGTGNKRYDNLAEIVLARFPRLDPKIIADVVGVEPEDRWILSTAARTEIGMFNLRHEKNLRSRGQQTSERSVASDEKEGLDVSRVVYGRALAVGLTDAQLDKEEAANISHLGDRNDQARDAYKVALETAAMWASLIVGTLVTVVATILTGGLALGPVAAMAVGAATAALSATAKSYVNKQILDNEWDSKDTNELIAHEVLTSVVTIGTTYYAQKFLATLGGLSSAARQATAARAVLGKQPPLWRVFLDQASEQVASEAMSTVVEAGLEATDPKHWIDGYREGSDEAMAAGKARLAAAPEAMARGVVTSLLTAGIGKVLRPGGGAHVDFSDAAKQTRSINLARNIKKVFGDPEQKLTGALVEWAMNHEDPIDWSQAPAALFQGTLNQYGQVATEMHSHTASVAAHGRHAKTQLALYGQEMTAAERTGYEHMNKDAGATDPLISAREYTNLRRQVAETGLGQWEAAHPDHPLDPAQREAFIRWVREADNPDVLKDRAKKNPLDVDVVRDAAPKPAIAAPGGAGDAAPGSAHHAGMFRALGADADLAPHQRTTQVMQVPAHPANASHAQPEVAHRPLHEEFPDLAHFHQLSEDVIGTHQRGIVEGKLQALSTDSKQAFQSLLGMMSSPVGRGFLYKALAAGSSISEIHWLAMQSMGRNDAWLLDNLTLSDPRGVGAGLMQQWSMGCNSAMTLTMRGNYDPVFALGLRLSNPNISTADFNDPMRFNQHLATLEGNMLQSGYQGDATPEARGTGGIAVPHAAGASRGRWADDLLNAQSGATGLEFTTNKHVTPADAVNALDATLHHGVQVPIVVGSADNRYAHYMLVTMSRPGQDGTPWYRISDSATGRSTWVSREQILSGRLPFGSGHTITAVEQPRPAGQRAQPLTPAEAPALASPAVLAVTQQMPAAYAAQTIALQSGGDGARTTTTAHEQAPTASAGAKTLVIPVPVQEAVADVVHPTAVAAAKSVAAPKPGTTHDPAREAFTAKWKDKPVDIQKFREQYSFEYDDAKARIDRVKEASPEVAAVLARVPDEELVAILLYTSTHFVEWNRTLREQDTGTNGLHEHGAGIALAEKGLSKLPTHQGTVHRGTSLPAEVIAKYVPGQVVTEDGFTSTSTQQSGTDNYQGNVQFIIESKTGRGVDALSRYDNEKEILFKPGTKFLVTDKERVGDQVIIRMREVDVEAAPGGPGGSHDASAARGRTSTRRSDEEIAARKAEVAEARAETAKRDARLVTEIHRVAPARSTTEGTRAEGSKPSPVDVPKVFDHITLGGGFAAVANEASRPKGDDSIMIASGGNPWDKAANRFGQPAGESEVPGAKQGHGMKDTASDPDARFMLAAEHAENVALNRNDHQLQTYTGQAGPAEARDPATWPQWALDSGANVRIPVVGPDNQVRYFYAKQVDVAVGPGPARMLLESVLDADTLKRMKEGNAFFVGDQSFTGEEIRPGDDVVNYGGGASAAWGTEASSKRAGSVEWIARIPKRQEQAELNARLQQLRADVQAARGSGDPDKVKAAEHALTEFTFKEAERHGFLPRNYEPGGAFDPVKQAENGGNVTRRTVDDCKKIEYVEGPDGKMKVKLTFIEKHPDGEREVIIWKDKLILSIGQNAAGAGGPVELVKQYEGQLVPIFGEPDPDGFKPVVGVQSPDGAVRILGAAATPSEVSALLDSRVMSVDKHQGNLAAQAEKLPRDSKGVVGGFALARKHIEEANSQLATKIRESKEQQRGDAGLAPAPESVGGRYQQGSGDPAK